jgi:branched-chain amino acid transport system substrate-binding protein
MEGHKMKRQCKKRTRRTLLKRGLVFGVAAAGILAFSIHTSAAQPREVKIGLLAPITGPASDWGQKVYWSFQFASRILNEEGGIKSLGGAKVKIVLADTESKPEVGAIQGEKLIADKEILMLSGTNQSATAMLVTQAAERNHICFITSTDADPQLTQRGFQYTYRTLPLMPSYARDLIYFFRDMGKKTGKAAKKMAILTVNNIAGISGGDAAAKYGKEVGFEIVDYSKYDLATTRDFTGYISKYKSAGVDLVIGHNYAQDSILITRAMKELNFNPMAYSGILGHLAAQDYADTIGKDSNYIMAGTFFVTHAKLPRLQEFVTRYNKQSKVPAEGLLSCGFTVLAILRKALEESPTYDREKLQQAIDKVELKAGEHYCMQIDGVKWAPNHDNERARVFIIQWKNGIDNVVAPAEYREKEAVWRPTWDEISKEK